MKKIIFLSLSVILVFSLQSCSILSNMGVGAIMGGRTYIDGTSHQSDAKVLLQQNNYKVVGTALGEARATYVFGIGGLGEQAVKGNAISDMFKNANLTGSQAIINVSFTRHDKSILVYNEVYWTCRGLIIEFLPE